LALQGAGFNYHGIHLARHRRNQNEEMKTADRTLIVANSRSPTNLLPVALTEDGTGSQESTNPRHVLSVPAFLTSWFPGKNARAEFFATVSTMMQKSS
jgi:hypothetical protein